MAAPSQPAQVQENLYYNNYAEDPYSQGYYDYSNDQAVFAAEDSPTDRLVLALGRREERGSSS